MAFLQSGRYRLIERKKLPIPITNETYTCCYTANLWNRKLTFHVEDIEIIRNGMLFVMVAIVTDVLKQSNQCSLRSMSTDSEKTVQKVKVLNKLFSC